MYTVGSSFGYSLAIFVYILQCCVLYTSRCTYMEYISYVHPQDSYELGHRTNFSPSHSPLSPQCLERPFDERSHNRRPSDEATMILRKISSSGNCGVSPFTMFGNSLGVNLPENKTHSLPPGFMPMESSSYQDFMDIPRMTQHNTLGRYTV